METILLVALFALYARYNRRARGLQMDAADEVIQLADPPLVAHPCVSAQHAKHCGLHVPCPLLTPGAAGAGCISSCIAHPCALPSQMQQAVTPPLMHDSGGRSDTCAGI